MWVWAIQSARDTPQLLPVSNSVLCNLTMLHICIWLQIEEQLEKNVGELETVKEEMASLKAQLYAKFGKTINLEDDTIEE